MSNKYVPMSIKSPYVNKEPKGGREMTDFPEAPQNTGISEVWPWKCLIAEKSEVLIRELETKTQGSPLWKPWYEMDFCFYGLMFLQNTWQVYLVHDFHCTALV